MANRGQAKLIDYRTPVLSIRQWLKELEQPNILSIVEIYCTTFGQCNVILPSINNIMMNIDNSSDRIKWLTVNICKLEDEQKQLLVDEDKKRSVHNDGTESFANTPQTELRVLNSTETGEKSITHDELQPLPATWDKIYIPKLERYTRYDAPQPLWLFVQDGNILYTLNSPNPPKMQRIIHCILNHIPLNDSELSSYDFTTATQDELNQRKARKQKLEAEKKQAAIERAKQLAKQQQVVKPVLQRPPNELLIECTIPIQSLKHTFSNKAVVVMYTKEADSIDFVYYSQSELNAVHHDIGTLHWNKVFSYVKPAPPTDETQKIDIEYKFVLYDSVEEIAKTKDTLNSAHSKVVGDGYLHYQQLFPPVSDDVDEIQKPVQLKLIADRNTAHASENHDTTVATMHINVKHAVSEGTVSTYNVIAHVATPVQPVTETEQIVSVPAESTESVTETIPHNIVLHVSVYDSNSGAAHAHHATTNMSVTATEYNHNTPIQIQTYEHVQRNYKFTVYNNTTQQTVAETTITSTELLKRMQLSRTVDIQCHDHTLSLKVYPEGSTYDEHIADLPAEQKLTLQFNMHGLQCPAVAQRNNATQLLAHHEHHAVVIALSEHTDIASHNIIAVTELATQESHNIFTSNDKLVFNTTAVIQKPIDDSTHSYKAAVYLLHTNSKLVTIHSLQHHIDNHTAHNVLSTVFTVNNDFLQLSMHHTLPCVDSTGHPTEHSTIECNINDVGSILQYNVNFNVATEEAHVFTVHSKADTETDYTALATLTDTHNIVLTRYSKIQTQYKLVYNTINDNAVQFATEFVLPDLVKSINESTEQFIPLSLTHDTDSAEPIHVTVTLLPLPPPTVVEIVEELPVPDENNNPNSLHIPEPEVEHSKKSSRRNTPSRPSSVRPARLSNPGTGTTGKHSKPVTPNNKLKPTTTNDKRKSGRPTAAE